MANFNLNSMYGVEFINSDKNCILIKFTADINRYKENTRKVTFLIENFPLPRKLKLNIALLNSDKVSRNLSFLLIKSILKRKLKDRHDTYQNISIIKIEYHLNYIKEFNRIKFYNDYFNYNFNYKENILNENTIEFLDNLEQENNYIYLLKIDSIENLFILGGFEFFTSEISLNSDSTKILKNYKSDKYRYVLKHIEDNIYSYNVDIIKCESLTIYKVTPQDLNFIYNSIYTYHDDHAWINPDYHHYNTINIHYDPGYNDEYD